MFTILQKAYYFDSSTLSYTKRAFAFGLFVFGFLYFFKPFGIHHLNEKLLLISLGFGVVTTVCMFSVGFVLQQYVINIISEEQWNVGKELVANFVNICLIAFCNMLFANLSGISNISFLNFIMYLFFTLGVGMFPIVLSVLLKEKHLSKKYTEQASQFTFTKAFDNKALSAENILLKSQNQNEDFTVHPQQIVFIKAADNYVEVYYKQGNKIQKRLLRNTLKNLSIELSKYSQLFRCHKSYIVNLEKIFRISGNAQGYVLHLQEGDFQIPVSRQHNEWIKNHFTIRP